MKATHLRLQLDRPDVFSKQHFDLWKSTKKYFSHFVCFDFQFKKLLNLDFLILKKYDIQSATLWRGNQLILAMHLYQVSPEKMRFGTIACCHDLTFDEAEFFWSDLLRQLKGVSFVGPINGHAYLGFSFLPQEILTKNVGISTSAYHPGISTLLMNPRLSIYRRYFSFETELNTTNKILRIDPADSLMTLRYFSRLFCKRDFGRMNQIVNQSFGQHFDFEALSDQENWDILKGSWLFLTPKYFRFILHKSQPIAFCFALKDYNFIFSHKNSDLKNVLWGLIKGPFIKRARLIHIGIVPEFQGQGLASALRIPMMNQMHKNGIVTMESSYVDEGNQNSLGNVQSTNGQKLHQFVLYQSS